MLKCSVCKEEKEKEFFNKEKRTKTGYAYECKACCAKRKKNYRDKNKSYCKYLDKKNREKNREKNRIRLLEYYYKDLEVSRKRGRDYYHKNREYILEKNKRENKTEIEIEIERERDRKYYKSKKIHFISRAKKWKLMNVDKTRAHWKVKYNLSKGKMVRPENCEICGKKGIIQAHHEDYSKPLEVKWICTFCHRRENLKV